MTPGTGKANDNFERNLQYYKFCAYGFLKNLRLFDIFLILFLRETGLTYLQIGALYSFRQITTNLLEIPSGLVADALGRKNALLFSFFAYLVSFALFYTGKSFGWFALAMVAYGTGEAFRSGTHKAMILQYLELNRMKAVKTRYYGSTRSWSQFGSAISSLLAMAVVFYAGNYRILFLYSGIPYILDFLLISTYPKALNNQLTDGWRALSLRILYNRFRHTVLDFVTIFKNKDTFKAIMSAATYIAVYKTIKDYLQPVLKVTAMALPVLVYLETEKRAAVLIGVLYFIIFLINSTASRNAWRIEKNVGDLPRAIDYAYLIGIISVLISGLFLWFNLPALAALFFVGLYFIQNIRRPLVVSFLSGHISSNVMASGLSVESQLETLLVAIYAPILGLLIDQLGLAGGFVITTFLFLAIYPLIRVGTLPEK